jgi:capsular polysaccharide biosynthesis protein
LKAAAVVWALKRYQIAIIAITGISFLISIFYCMYVVKPVYGAKAVIMVTTTDENNEQKFDYSTILANRQLVKTYSEIIKSSTVLDRVVLQMGEYITLEQLRKAISVKQVGSTELLEISALSGDPLIAAYIANETADAFVRHIEGVFRLSNVKILETAVENANPVKPNICINIVAALMLGFFTAVAFCLTLVYLRKPVGMPGMVDASVLFMTQIPKLNKKNKNWVNLFKNKIIHNAFVYLQIVLIKKVGKNKIILFTSAVDGEGKSTISEGLALSLSQSGYKVTMINTDFSRIEAQGLFKGMPLRKRISETDDVLDVLQSDGCPELRIVVAKSPIVDSYQFLSTTAFESFLQEAAAKSDFILINGPALQEHAEAILLATKVDGVLLVARSDTPVEQFNKGLRSLESVNAGLLGIILNNI